LTTGRETSTVRAVEKPALNYELEDALELGTAAQFKALGHPLRHRLLGLLKQRAATITQLAEAIGGLKGTVNHHVKVLEAAGLVRVVRTGKVRGAVERYYGRTAWRLELSDDPTANTLLLRLVSGEIVASAPGQPHLLQLRRLPLSAGQALALADRLQAVADEFERAEPAAPPDGQLWGVLLGVYPTDVPILSTGPEAR
jgi:DNA-binding transcriptional ArsR family regulator